MEWHTYRIQKIVDECLALLKSGSEVPMALCDRLAEAAVQDPEGRDPQDTTWAVFGATEFYASSFVVEDIMDDMLGTMTDVEALTLTDSEIVRAFRKAWRASFEAPFGFYCRQIFGTSGEFVWAMLQPREAALGDVPEVYGVHATLDDVEAKCRAQGFLFAANADGLPPGTGGEDVRFRFGDGDGFTDAEVVQMFREYLLSEESLG